MQLLTSKVMKLFFSSLLLLASIALFQTSALASENTALRKVFLKAEKQVWQANTQSYKNLYQQLHYYPLQPYLDQKRLMNNIRLSHTKEIANFLEEYKGTPLDWPLRKKWLTYLAKRKKHILFQEFYIPTTNAELTCQYYRFQLQSGIKPQNIMPKVTKLWVVGKSQPKVCDPLFKQWQQAGYRTQEVIWQRLALAADGGKHTLIPYLTKLLVKEDQYLAKLWHKVRRDPAYIRKTSAFKNKSAKEAIIAAYGLKRLIWRSPNSAINNFKVLGKYLPFTEKQKKQITLKFAVALASKNHKKAEEWLTQVDDNLLTKNIIQWRLADLLRKQDWQAMLQVLEALPESQKVSKQWQYWYGRTLIYTGQAEEGQALLAKLATKRHYYGFLAASFIKEPVNLEDKPLDITQQERFNLMSNPAAKRAFELFHIDRFHQARKEWNYWLSQLTDREKLVAAKIANEAQWFDRAIFTLSSVGYLDDVDLRFPLAFDNDITRSSKQNKINPAWAFAIARRESSFMSDAYSHAGARGLMQVMPATAKQLKKKKVSKKQLLNAKQNIELGTYYMKRLLDRYDGNQVLATASYNAGPYRVKKWLKGKPALPADIWIETIPYKETREYVKSVLAYQQIYQLKVGQNKSLFDKIITMSIVQ